MNTGSAQLPLVNNDYFPFTTPSFEVEVKFTINGESKWLEVLGCGVVHTDIMSNCNLSGTKAWAFGLGLERLAMILFNIPDIRLFWSTNDKFSKQFVNCDISTIHNIKFKPFSVLPVITRDVSFWLPVDNSNYVENNFYELSRDTFGDMIESIQVLDRFQSSKTGRNSITYRFTLSSYDDNLTDPAVFTQKSNSMMTDFRNQLLQLQYEMR